MIASVGSPTTPSPNRAPSWLSIRGWCLPAKRFLGWTAAQGWSVPTRHLNWSACDAWRASFEALVSKSAIELSHLLARWDVRLSDLGGDPARENWRRFRPLRLSREEDWSDWLAHLLERGVTGRFPARLLAADVGEADRWRVRSAEREVSAEGYRADLVLRFEDGSWMHVEVKVGDLDLAKTPGTGRALLSRESGRFRGNVLLLPDEDVASWDVDASDLPDGGASVTVRTWSEVARALRAGLLEGASETPAWRVWAWAFTGAIEQRVLGHRTVPRDPERKPGRASARDVEYMSHLQGLIADEESS